MGAMKIQTLRPAVSIDLAPGDWIVLLSDGIYEHEDVDGRQFGRGRVEQIVQDHHLDAPPDLAGRLLSAVQAHAGGAPQDDDITMVLIRRLDIP
mgnify:CR=1 FL=1